MKITFTRGAENTYTITALRDDGVLLHVPSGDRKFPLPHDIAHYIVENGLGLKNGFWGRVALGAVFPGMSVLSGRQPAHAAERSKSILRNAEQQGVEAEVMVGFLLQITRDGLEVNWPVVRRLLGEQWRSSKPERSLPDAREVLAICVALREAERQWQALDVGQSMMDVWPVEMHKTR